MDNTRSYLTRKLREELSDTCLRAGPASAALVVLYQHPFFHFLRLDQINLILVVFLLSSYAARTGLYFAKGLSDSKWLAIHTIVIGLHALGWSALLINDIWKYHLEHSELVVFTYIMFAGLCAAASYALSMSKRDFYAFVTPILTAQIIAFFLNDYSPELQVCGSVTIVLFFIFLTAQRARSEKSWVEQRTLNFDLQNMLNSLPGGLAHEINNPVAIISGRAQQLILKINQDTASKENLLKGLNEINSTSERINKIIQRLKQFSDNQKSN